MEELDLKELFNLLWKRKMLIIICVLIGALSGYFFNAQITEPLYEARAKIILSVRGNNQTNTEKSSTITTEDIKLSENLMDTYTEIIKSDNLLDTIKSTFNLDIQTKDLRKNVNLDQKSDSVVFEISVKYNNPETAQQIANEIPNVFFEKIQDLYNISNAEVLDPAKLPQEPCNIKPMKYTLIGAVIGLILSIMVVFVIKIFNDNITSESDVEDRVKVPVLAQIAQLPPRERLSVYDVKSECSEAFRTLISNIKYLKASTILVTSNTPSEGKSTVSSNMAITYARTGKKVLLIDADIRKGRQQSIFKIPRSEGLSDIVESNPKEIQLDKYIRHTKLVENLDIITKGITELDYTKLLYTTVLEDIVRIARERYDFVIIDGTPASIVADDVTLTKIVDATLIVVRYNKTPVDAVKKIKNRVERNGGKILGVVLNYVPKSSKKYGYYSDSPRNAKRSKRTSTKGRARR